ncbi:hypothetical protein [Rhizobium sp. Root1203]|uniref:COG3904 family protein n=1 Tax=Rhizobium sp. Root1203 TaxID=1736427 RepID=UPI00070EE54C|nr:hypothetical protein [Rhizobium sp. Root1203]
MSALEFEPVKKDNGEKWLIAQGDINPGDGERLRDALRSGAYDGGLFVINSDGGSVADGLEIGRAVWRANMTTMVAPHGQCLSACFFAFIGGRKRHVPETAQLGSHQFYHAPGATEDGAEAMTTSQAVTGEILTFALQTGIDPQALTYILQTKPTDMFVFDRLMLTKFRLDDPIGKPPKSEGPIVLPSGSAKPGCTFPDGFLASDPLGLYPQCR